MEQHASLPRGTSSNTPKIGVVTVLFNSASVLEDFKSSIDGQQWSNFMVIAVDNASTDGSVQMCTDQRPSYVVIENATNVGVAAANNQGIRLALEAGCEYVLLLNNDTVFAPDLFRNLVQGISDHSCQMTTPLCLFSAPPNRVWCAGGGFNALMGYRANHYGYGEENTGQFPAKQVQYTTTCCVLVHRSVFETVGLMDEAYFVYWDDTDFMLRAYRAGIKLFFLPDAVLYHKVSSLTGLASPFTIRMNTRNHAYYLRKHLGSFYASLFTFMYCAFYSMIIVFGGSRKETGKLQLRSWMEGWHMRSSA